jgi:hypothetical protein
VTALEGYKWWFSHYFFTICSLGTGLKDRKSPNKQAANSQIAVTADGKEIVAVSRKANRIHIDRTLSSSPTSGKVARSDPVSAMVLAALERKRLSAAANFWTIGKKIRVSVKGFATVTATTPTSLTAGGLPLHGVDRHSTATPGRKARRPRGAYHRSERGAGLY